MKASRATLLLGVLGATSASASHTKTPVEQVVNLLKDLKSNIEKDREEEKKAYDKYACWCTSTASRKAKAIHTARDDLNELGSEILRLKSKCKRLATEIADNLSDIKDNQQEQYEATETREEENKSFMATAAESKQAMGTMDKVLNVLKGAALVQKNGGKDAEASAERVQAQVQAAISELPDGVMMRMSPKSLSMLKQAEKGDFKPSHDTLETILKALDDEITTDFGTREEEETQLDEDYEDIMASKQKEMVTLEEGIAKKEKEKAEAEIELAAATQEYDDTDTQMNRDIEFFDEAKESCTDKSEEWTEREDLRTAELDGIKEALKILTSDEAREMFASAIKPGFETFIQVDALTTNPVLAATEKAYNVVKMLSNKADDKKAIEFANLAVTIKESGKKGARDQFAAVLTEIDKIIGNLKDEGKADIDKRDECKEQYQSIALEIQERNWKVEKNEAKIAKLEDMIEKKQEEKAKTIEEIEAVEKEIEALEDQRKEDADAFEQAKSDDESAIKLLHQARDALKQFYEDNDIDMGELQEPAFLAKKLVAKKGGEPEFERHEDDAPDAEFSGKGNSKNQAKGILSLLAMISEDLEDEVKNAIKAEDKAIEAYDKQLKVTKDLKDDLEEKKTNIQSVIDEHDTSKTNEEDDMADNKDAIESEKTYKADIQVDCDFILKAFDYRRERRAMEIDALTNAKAMLRGAAPGAFLEKKVPVKPH